MTRPSGEAIRIGGTITQIVKAPRLLRARLDKERMSSADDGELVVEVNGSPVRVAVPGKSLRDDARSEKASWGEIVAKSGGRFNAGQAPAFSAASLEVVELASGAEIEIYGEVASRAFNEDGGMRDAPTHQVQAIRALLVASGSGRTARIDRGLAELFPPATRPAQISRAERRARARAERAMDPRSSEPGSPHFQHGAVIVVHALVWLAAAIVCAIVSGVTRKPIWAGFALAAAFIALLVRPTPLAIRLRAVEKSYGFGGGLTTGWWVAIVLTWACLMIPAVSEAGAAGIAWMTLPLVAIHLVELVAAMPAYAAFGSMRRAPLWTGELGVRAALEGVVLDPTPATVGGGHVAIGRGTGYDESIGSNPDKVVWQRFHGVGSFLIKTTAGTVEVFPQQIVWGTSVTGRVKTSDRGADYEEIEIIPVGAKVLAAGWIEAGPQGGPPRLVARGTAPAVLVATGVHGDPRSWLGRLRTARTITLLGVLAIGAALAALIKAV